MSFTDLPSSGTPFRGGDDAGGPNLSNITAAKLHTLHIQRESKLSHTPGEDKPGKIKLFI